MQSETKGQSQKLPLILATNVGKLSHVCRLMRLRDNTHVPFVLLARTPSYDLVQRKDVTITMGRKKRHDIRVRMSDEEYAILKNRIDDCGISIQDYGVRMLLEQPVVTRMEIDELKNISSELHDAVRVHRGIGNNINQVAKKANSVGYDTKDFVTIQEEYRKNHETMERIWMIARRLISDGNHKNDRS